MNSINKIFTRFLFCAIMATLFIVALPTHKASAKGSELSIKERFDINKGFSAEGVAFNINIGGDVAAQWDEAGGQAGINMTGHFTAAGQEFGMDLNCSAKFSTRVKICAHLTEGTIEMVEGGATEGCELHADLNGKTIDLTGSNGTDIGASFCVAMEPRPSVSNMNGVWFHLKAYAHAGFDTVFGSVSLNENISLTKKTINW